MMPKIEVDVPQRFIDVLDHGREFEVDEYGRLSSRPIRPWYPASWLDDAGNPLPDVHEVTPGEWPPCKPRDLVEALREDDRLRQRYAVSTAMAEDRTWIDKVAIRIVRRAGE
jgi:hypothetical protein